MSTGCQLTCTGSSPPGTAHLCKDEAEGPLVHPHELAVPHGPGAALVNSPGCEFEAPHHLPPPPLELHNRGLLLLVTTGRSLVVKRLHAAADVDEEAVGRLALPACRVAVSSRERGVGGGGRAVRVGDRGRCERGGEADDENAGEVNAGKNKARRWRIVMWTLGRGVQLSTAPLCDETGGKCQMIQPYTAAVGKTSHLRRKVASRCR